MPERLLLHQFNLKDRNKNCKLVTRVRKTKIVYSCNYNDNHNFLIQELISIIYGLGSYRLVIV